jgi:hypothetical protein
MDTIMEPVSIRQKLHQYIDKGDDKLLKLMYAVAKEYNEDDDFEYEFSEADIRQFDERRAKRLNGQSKTYSWKDAKDIIISQKKME